MSAVKGYTRPHPGIFLARAIMEPEEIAPADIAAALNLSEPALQRFLEGRAPVTRPMAEGLAAYFGSTVDYWLQMQELYDAQQTALTKQA